MARLFYGHLSCALKYARSYLRQEKIIAAPTDTIYGFLGTYSNTAIKKIHHLKQRENPFLILLPHISQLENFAEIENWQWKFLSALMPGRNTVILKKKPQKFYPPQDSIAIRVPCVADSLFLNTLLKSTGALVAPSLNRHGEPPLCEAIEIERDFGADVAAIFIDPAYREKPPSSLWKFDDEKERIIKIR